MIVRLESVCGEQGVLVAVASVDGVLLAGAHPLANGSADDIRAGFARAGLEWSPAWPRRVEDALLEVSREARERGAAVPEFSMAAVAITGSRVDVRWCGDVRVYASAPDANWHTIDHTVKFAPDEELPAGAPDFIRSAMPSVYTRYLSANEKHTGSAAAWEARTREWTIAICTNGFHGHGDPIVHAPVVLNAPPVPVAPTRADFLARVRIATMRQA
ncbi:MAG: hypothetical protein AMXMBFR56_76720 [Polyangiaceae bacterium]